MQGAPELCVAIIMCINILLLQLHALKKKLLSFFFYLYLQLES